MTIFILLGNMWNKKKNIFMYLLILIISFIPQKADFFFFFFKNVSELKYMFCSKTSLSHFTFYLFYFYFS